MQRTVLLAAALVLLAGCGERRARFHLDQLSSPDRQARQRASRALVEIGEAAVAPLVARAQSGSDSLAYISAQILGRIGSTRAIPFLRELTQRDNAFVRREAVVALGQIGHRPLLAPLADILAVDGHSEVRAAAAQSLAKLRDTLAVVPLIAALQDTASLVRQQALAGLQYLWTPEAEAAARRGLADPDETVRYIAAQMLGIHRTLAARPDLCVALDDSSAWVRSEAAHSLGLLGDTTAVASLERLLKRSDGPDAEAARQALRLLTGLDYVVVE